MTRYFIFLDIYNWLGIYSLLTRELNKKKKKKNKSVNITEANFGALSRSDPKRKKKEKKRFLGRTVCSPPTYTQLGLVLYYYYYYCCCVSQQLLRLPHNKRNVCGNYTLWKLLFSTPKNLSDFQSAKEKIVKRSCTTFRWTSLKNKIYIGPNQHTAKVLSIFFFFLFWASPSWFSRRP